MAVESQGVGPDVVAPERRLESKPQSLGLAQKFRSALGQVDGGGNFRRQALGGVDIALDLAERDCAFGEFAVGVENGISESFQP